MYQKKQHPIPSRTSPKGGNRACLCANGTYSIKCCDGSLIAQGIGNITAPSIPENAVYHNGEIVTHNNEIVTHNG